MARITAAIVAVAALTACHAPPRAEQYSIVRLDSEPARMTPYGLLHTDLIRDNRTGITFPACQTDAGEADCTTGAEP
jgi:hypothetical protein